ncbi:Endonuclease/exonuclease/phosphatase superfamily [Sesbania bispinosa]|nr:Endonuclease/exonuclease/phosphatase superfamily [Sesbania bispinosa]
MVNDNGGAQPPGGGAPRKEGISQDQSHHSSAPTDTSPINFVVDPNTDFMHGDWLVVSKVDVARDKSKDFTNHAHGPTAVQRKRPRKENAPSSSKAQVDPTHAPHVDKNMGPIIVKDKAIAGSVYSEPKPVWMGGTKVFEFGNNVKTAMNLIQVGQNKFLFRDGESKDHVPCNDKLEEGNISKVEIINHENKSFDELSHVDRGPVEGRVVSTKGVVESFWSSLRYELYALMEASGHSGGIWVLGEIGSGFSFSIIDSFHQAITFRISKGSEAWSCSAIYASPCPAVRELLWAHLALLRNSISIPWALLGDFNEILLPSEVRGGSFLASRAFKFAQVLESCRLIDIGAIGSKYTWFRKEHGGRSIAKRLDRVLVDCDWRLMMPDAFVEVMCRIKSDHAPIILHYSDSPASKKDRPFQFLDAWASHEGYREVMINAWQGNHQGVVARLHKSSILLVGEYQRRRSYHGLGWLWKALLKKFQPEFDPDIWIQEEGSESWEQDNRGKNEALKFKNQLGREDAIHKEVEQVKETNIKMVMAEKEMETELELHAGTTVEVQEADVANKIEGEESDADWGYIKTKKEGFKEMTTRFKNSDVLDKHPPQEPPDWVAFVVPKTTPTEQVVVLLQRNVLRKGTRSKSRNKSTKMVNCQPRWILCKTFKGRWQQEGLRGFSFDPGARLLLSDTFTPDSLNLSDGGYHMKLRNFIWNGNPNSRGWHPISWDKMILPKRRGGLGVRDTCSTNTAMLGKLVWALLTQEDKFWVQVLKAKYLPGNSVLSATTPIGASYIWKGIVRAKNALLEGFDFRLGQGDTSVWYTDWTSLGRLCDLVPFVHISDTNLVLRDLVVHSRWSFNQVRTWIPQEFVDLIQDRPARLFSTSSDCWNWRANGNGTFNTASAYKWLRMDSGVMIKIHFLGSGSCFVQRKLDSLFGLFSMMVSLQMKKGDSVEVEFSAMRFEMQFAWDKGFRSVVLESDAKEIIHTTLQQHDVELSHRHSGVIVFIHELLERDWSVELKYIPREANFPADGWLRMGLEMTLLSICCRNLLLRLRR